MKKLTHLILIIMIVASGFAGIFAIIPHVVSQYTPHDPIIIDGDADFAAQAASEGWPGDGTEGNPYVIEGYEISTEYDFCIEIRWTTVHFVIRDSMIRRSEISNTSIYQSRQGGIYLEHVTDGNIINCTLEKNKCGIALYYSIGINITKNTMINNGIHIDGFGEWHGLGYWNTHSIDTSNTVNGKPVYYWKNQSGGTIPSGAGQVILANCSNIRIGRQDLNHVSIGIQFAYCYNNTIIQNNITSNSEYGIDFHHSNRNIISNNNVNSNDEYGIFLFHSDTNYILNNNISANNKSGVCIGQSSGNNITGNTFSANNEFGIEFYDSIGNNISSNIVSENKLGGILLSDSDCNNIYFNNIANNKCGIGLDESKENDIQNNTMSGDGIFIEGYSVDYWNTNTIDTSNTVNEKTIYLWKNQTGGKIPPDAGQVILANCTNVTIEGQELSFTYIAIQLVYSSYISIIDNNASFNGEYGIYLWQSNMNTITNNIASNGEYGIYLENSMGNNITYNTISSNKIAGIKLYRATNNTFHHNNIIDNDYQLSSVGSVMNTWNDGNGNGNYWSDYIGVDDGSDGRTAGDGVGDTDLPHQGVDYYPLTNKRGSISFGLWFIGLMLPFIVIILIILVLVIRRKRKPSETPPEAEI